MANKVGSKVHYGFSLLHYAVIENYGENAETKKNEYTYSATKRINGAVSASLSPTGSSTPFYADNGIYYNVKANTGYEGDVEMALIPTDFRTDVLGEENINGVILENSDAQGKECALLFEISGDVTHRRHVMYRNSIERPSVESSTTEDTITPNTDTLTITAMPRENDHYVKAYLDMPQERDDNYEAKKQMYDNWFTKVWQPEEIKALATSAASYSADSAKSKNRF